MSEKSDDQKSQSSIASALQALSQEFKHISLNFKELVLDNKKQHKTSIRDTIAIVSISLGLLGIGVNWRGQINLEKISQIREQTKTVQIQHQNLRKAISKAATVVINQINRCPVTHLPDLKEMQAARINALIDVRAYDSGITLEVDKKLQPVASKLIKGIYDIPVDRICSMNVKKYDEESYALYVQINRIFRAYVEEQHEKIKATEKRWV